MLYVISFIVHKTSSEEVAHQSQHRSFFELDRWDVPSCKDSGENRCPQRRQDRVPTGASRSFREHGGASLLSSEMLVQFYSQHNEGVQPELRVPMSQLQLQLGIQPDAEVSDESRIIPATVAARIRNHTE